MLQVFGSFSPAMAEEAHKLDWLWMSQKQKIK
jgi:hypothetical protein